MSLQEVRDQHDALRSHAYARAGASMQISRVDVLAHARWPCWCFVAQRARRQRFIHGRTTHHWLVCSIALYILVSYKQLQMLNLLICSRSSFLFSLSSIFHLLVVPEFHASCYWIALLILFCVRKPASRRTADSLDHAGSKLPSAHFQYRSLPPEKLRATTNA